MIERTRVVLTVAALVALLFPGSQAWARRVDFEAGAGVMVSLKTQTNRPIDNGLAYGGQLVVNLKEKVDLELGFLRAEGDDPDDNENQRDVDMVNLGLRLYPWAAPGVPGAFFIAVGGGRVTGLRVGETNYSMYIGPGLRIQAGEKSGFSLRLPVVVNAEGRTDPFIMPTLSWFLQFD